MSGVLEGGCQQLLQLSREASILQKCRPALGPNEPHGNLVETQKVRAALTA